MDYIVLDIDKRDRLLALKEEFKSDMANHASDVHPIPIKNDLFILPVSVLTDPAFQGIKQRIIDNGNVGLIVIREVSQNEFIEPTEE